MLSVSVRSQCTRLVLDKEWDKAATVCDDLLDWIVNASGGIDRDDLRTFASDLDSNIALFLNLQATKAKIGVPQNVRNAAPWDSAG